MKKILFPTDFSSLARRALSSLVTYLQEQKTPSQLILLNTYYPPESFIEDQVIQKHDESRKKSLEGLQKELRFLEGMTQKDVLTFKVVSQLGSLENVIDRLVKSEDIDALIMAQNKHTTNDQNKWRDIPCPIFLIPAVDGSEILNIEKFRLRGRPNGRSLRKDTPFV